MIDALAKTIARFQVRSPWVVIVVFAIVTLFLLPGILRLVGNVEPSLEKVLPSDVEEVKAMNDMRTQFGADMMYILVEPDTSLLSDVRHPAALAFMDTLTKRLATHEGILEVTSVADIIRREHGGIIPADTQAVKETLRMHAGEASQFINPDADLAIIRVRSNTGASAELIGKVMTSIEGDIRSLERINPGLGLRVTGFNAIDKATFDVIMSDFAWITLVSMALVLLVVFTVFRSFIRGILPMAVVMVAILWTMGIAGYLGLTITVVSMVSAAMIMGLGIDFGIHQVHTYHSLRNKRKTSSEAVEGTLVELLRAMLGASTTTMAGFLALLFGVLPAMKTLAIILAIGIGTTLIGAVLLLPVLLYLSDTATTTMTHTR